MTRIILALAALTIATPASAQCVYNCYPNPPHPNMDQYAIDGSHWSPTPPNYFNPPAPVPQPYTAPIFIPAGPNPNPPPRLW